VTQATAAAKWESSAEASRKVKREQRAGTGTLEARLERKLTAARERRSVIRSFESHRTLLGASGQRALAESALRRAHRRLAKTTKEIADLQSAIRARDSRRRAKAPPRRAICDVFDQYCKQAVAVAWCESRLQTTARNGEYLGLFQMGSSARRLYGHDSTAYGQAVAAHKYFVSSGRDWSPWSCKP
jgi:hypothetical protein